MTTPTNEAAASGEVTCEHDWHVVHPCPECGVDALRAAPPLLQERDRLDVERLADAMAATKWAWLSWTDQEPADSDGRFRRWTAFRNAAISLAAEYARLAATPTAEEPSDD